MGEKEEEKKEEEVEEEEEKEEEEKEEEEKEEEEKEEEEKEEEEEEKEEKAKKKEKEKEKEKELTRGGQNTQTFETSQGNELNDKKEYLNNEKKQLYDLMCSIPETFSYLEFNQLKQEVQVIDFTMMSGPKEEDGYFPNVAQIKMNDLKNVYPNSLTPKAAPKVI